MGAGSTSRIETVERLRERIRQLEADPRPSLSVVRTGVSLFDELLGDGLPLGTVVELCGEAASGRTSLALRAVAQATGSGSLAAYVDCPGELYGPLAHSMGVALDSLLVVRPGKPKQGLWAALQLLRSGSFPCTVLDLTRSRLRLSLADGKKLTAAATRSGCLLLLLTSPDAPAEGGLRLQFSALGLEGLFVEVLRSRRGGCRGATIPWDALYPQAPVWRHRRPEQVQIRSTGPRVRVPAFYRENPSIERNGCDGVHGQRPGRDLAMPGLADPGVLGG